MNNYRIFGEFTTLSPLSHISESIGTITYLCEEPILQTDGSVEPVFSYSGNAWRGQMRDLSAIYMLKKLGGPQLNTESFHLLFSGGKIGGEQSIDLNQARTIRQAVPMISLFGGGVGNQIMPGKLRVGSSYPVCVESAPVLKASYHADCLKSSYRQLTSEKSFTRKDDSKNPGVNNYINPAALALIENDKKTKKDDEVSTQMRMTSELLIAGVKLVHEIDMLSCSEIELGVIVSALHAFSESPYIGGQCNRGHGKVSYSSQIINLSTGETSDFIQINNSGIPNLSQLANSSKEAYDKLLVEQYNRYLETKKPEIENLLGSV